MKWTATERSLGGDFTFRDKSGNILYRTKMKFFLTNKTRLYDREGHEVGRLTARGEVCPQLFLQMNGVSYGSLRWNPFAPDIDAKFHLDYQGWSIRKCPEDWHYVIVDGSGRKMAEVNKNLQPEKIFVLRRVYEMQVESPEHEMLCLLFFAAMLKAIHGRRY